MTVALGDIGVARILSEVHFFPHKVDDLFLVVASKRRSKTTNSSSKSSQRSKKCPKN